MKLHSKEKMYVCMRESDYAGVCIGEENLCLFVCACEYERDFMSVRVRKMCENRDMVCKRAFNKEKKCVFVV